jgi:hypothetical protein
MEKMKYLIRWWNWKYTIPMQVLKKISPHVNMLGKLIVATLYNFIALNAMLLNGKINMLIREKSNAVTMPVLVASQWFKNGDHPNDNCLPYVQDNGSPFLSEGKVVRYFRHPQINGHNLCATCLRTHNEHGFIDTNNFDTTPFVNAKYTLCTLKKSTVCPTDWVIQNGDKYFAISDKNLRFNFQVMEE